MERQRYCCGATPLVGVVTNIQTPGSRAHTRASSIGLATVIIGHVDRIGLESSGGIKRAADDLVWRPNEAANNLRKVAGAIREHSKLANARVSEFCNKATSPGQIAR
jgi:hypothetical protein